jgi:hypothetical protein
MRRALVFSTFALVVWSAVAVAQTRPASTAANPLDLNSASRDDLMTLEGSAR